MIITNDNFDLLKSYVANVDSTLDRMESDATLPDEDFEPQKYSYHVGAQHAFSDVLDLVEVQQEKKTAINGRGLTITLVTVGTVGAITYRKEIKAGLKKLKAKFRG